MTGTDPIELSKALETTVENINTNAASDNIELNNTSTLSNLGSQILLKKEQLIKMKNEKLNNQIKQLQNYESSIINKDRLIDETNKYIEKNNLNIRFLIFALVIAVLGFFVFALYNFGKISNNLFNILSILLTIIFVVVILYAYNIFYFRTAVNFLDYRKNTKLENAVSNWTNYSETNLQKNLYGSRSDWEDENCECPPDEEIYPEEPNISVTTQPGYYYYDGNAPKQLVVNNDKLGGEPINVSDNPNIRPEPKIFDKIKWVDHDNYTYSMSDEEGVYEINPNDNKLNKNGLLVNNSTFTANL